MGCCKSCDDHSSSCLGAKPALLVQAADEKHVVVWGPASIEVTSADDKYIEIQAIKNALPQLLRRDRISVLHKDQLVGSLHEAYPADPNKAPSDTARRLIEHLGGVLPTKVMPITEEIAQAFPHLKPMIGKEAFFACGVIWGDNKTSRHIAEQAKAGVFDSVSISGVPVESHEEHFCDHKGCRTRQRVVELDLSAITLASTREHPDEYFSAKARNQGAKIMVVQQAHTEEEDTFEEGIQANGLDFESLDACVLWAGNQPGMADPKAFCEGLRKESVDLAEAEMKIVVEQTGGAKPVRLKKGEKPPAGAKVITGPRGGKYYVPAAGGAGPSPEKKPAAPKPEDDDMLQDIADDIESDLKADEDWEREQERKAVDVSDDDMKAMNDDDLMAHREKLRAAMRDESSTPEARKKAFDRWQRANSIASNPSTRPDGSTKLRDKFRDDAERALKEDPSIEDPIGTVTTTPDGAEIFTPHEAKREGKKVFSAKRAVRAHPERFNKSDDPMILNKAAQFNNLRLHDRQLKDIVEKARKRENSKRSSGIDKVSARNERIAAESILIDRGVLDTNLKPVAEEASVTRRTTKEIAQALNVALSDGQKKTFSLDMIAQAIGKPRSKTSMKQPKPTEQAKEEANKKAAEAPVEQQEEAPAEPAEAPTELDAIKEILIDLSRRLEAVEQKAGTTSDEPAPEEPVTETEPKEDDDEDKKTEQAAAEAAVEQAIKPLKAEIARLTALVEQGKAEEKPDAPKGSPSTPQQIEQALAVKKAATPDPATPPAATTPKVPSLIEAAESGDPGRFRQELAKARQRSQ